MRRAEQVPVVLLDVNLQSLSLVRALGRRGIPLIGVVTESGRYEHSTRYVEIIRTPDPGPAALLTALADIARRPGPAPILVPTSDDMALFASAHRHILARDFRVFLPPHDVLAGLVSKDGMAALATDAGVAQPGCWSPDSEQQLRTDIAEMRFPVLVKPRHSSDWERPAVREIVQGKVARCEDARELIETWAALQAVASDVVVQEEVIGDDENLVYYVGYFDRDSRPLASFTGTKLRTLPIHYGSASAAVSCRHEEVIRISERFMQSIGYRGHVGIEYKIDPRDGIPRLIEVNARWGLWDGLGARCGMDFADLNFRYQTGDEIEPITEFTEGEHWVAFRRDLWAVGGYAEEGTMTRGRWIRELATRSTQWAVWAPDDPVPFMLSSLELATAVATGIVGKIARTVGLSSASELVTPAPVPAKR